MPSWEMKIITAEALRLLAQASDDADLRAELRALAEEILKATDAAPEFPQTQEDDPHAPLKELTLGRSTPPRPAVIVALNHDTAGTADLAEIEAHCRIKAEAAALASSRLRGPVSETPDDPDVDERAVRMTDWYYWRNAKDELEPVDVTSLDDLAGCYATLAEALALVEASRSGSRGQTEKALSLLAEAQASVRSAIQTLSGPDDPDQINVFAWLKETSARHHLYLKRFMRAEDLATPADWPDLVDRIFTAYPHGRAPVKAKRRVPETQRSEPNAEVLEARRLLAGRSVVLIGGGCRPEARESLIADLGLSDLVWIETREHQSIAGFEPAIARDDVAVVLLAIRWSSHAFGDVKTFCNRHGKPLVRLPGGYNPNQVAAHILAQSSGKLA